MNHVHFDSYALSLSGLQYPDGTSQLLDTLMSSFGAKHVQKGGQAPSNKGCVSIYIQSPHVVFQ